MAVSRYLFWNLPLVGGFALRFLPLGFVERRLDEFNREVGPAVVHLHPWEIDAMGPEARSISVVVRGLKRYGRSGLAPKLERLLGAHSFGAIAAVFPEVGAAASVAERHDTLST